MRTEIINSSPAPLTNYPKNKPHKFNYFLPHKYNNYNSYTSRLRNPLYNKLKIKIDDNQLLMDSILKKLLLTKKSKDLTNLIYSPVVSTNLNILLNSIAEKIIARGLYTFRYRFDNVICILAAYAHKLNRYLSQLQQDKIIKEFEDYINISVERQCLLILRLTTSTQLDTSVFLQTLLKKATSCMLKNNDNNFKFFYQLYRIYNGTLQEQHLDLREYLLAIFKAQQHPDLSLSCCYNALFNYAVDTLSQQPHFVICFHAFIKSLYKDTTKYELICKLIKKIGENLKQALTNHESTLPILRYNYFNWIDDCIQIIIDTKEDKDASKIYKFYNELLQLLLSHTLTLTPSILNKLTPLHRLNQFAQDSISQNPANSDEFKTGRTLIQCISGALLNAVYTNFCELDEDLMCKNNQKSALFDFIDYRLKLILSTLNRYNRSQLSNPEIIMKLQDFIENGDLTSNEITYLIRIIKPQDLEILQTNREISHSIWQKLVKYRLNHEDYSHLKAIITLTLAGASNFTFQIPSLINSEQKALNEVNIANRLGFKPSDQAVTNSLKYLLARNQKFIDYLQFTRVYPLADLDCFSSNHHLMPQQDRLQLLFNQAVPTLIKHCKQVKENSLSSQKLKTLQANFRKLHQFLKQHAKTLITYSLSLTT